MSITNLRNVNYSGGTDKDTKKARPFHLVLNAKYAFYMQCEPIDRFLFDANFYRKRFSKQAIETWILIPVIPRNIYEAELGSNILIFKT